MSQLINKVALVTGGASGIGKAFVEAFVKEGAKVIIADVNDKQGSKLAEKLGENAVYIHTDVSKEANVKAAIHLAVDTYDRLDCLVNNAGVSGNPAAIEELSEEEFNHIISINLFGVAMGVKHAAPVMRKQGSGSIINISSPSSEKTFGFNPMYNVSKSAVNHLTRCNAVALGKDNIRVNAILPGFTLTPIVLKALDIPNPEESFADAQQALGDLFAGNQPIPRTCSLQDLANLAVFLASDKSTFINGQIMAVDGGLSVSPPELQPIDPEIVNSYIQSKK